MMCGRDAVIAATERAIDLINELKAEFGPLMFVQSGGCCDGSAPMCFQEGDFLLGPGDRLLGEIAGCHFYMDEDLFERWGRPRLLIDCAPGNGDSFSLEGRLGMHFVARTQSIVLHRPSAR
jgi:uncharacterized protein (DUF779 family)